MTKKAKATAETTVRVRMYNVGFGDCFLLRIPTDEGERRMLVDCGYHSQGKGEFSDAELVEQIRSDLDGEPLDVVVATHRHQDHISGFGETDLWKNIPVNEVWLPFTADPAASDDIPELRAWQGLMDRAEKLFGPAGALTSGAAAALGARDADERAAAAFMLWNARSNAPGIENLLRGMKRANGKLSKRRFLPENRDTYPTHFTTPTLPGVVTYVLGPPADPTFRKSKKVPDSWAFSAALPTSDDDTGPTFGVEWQVPADRLPAKKPFMPSTLQAMRLFNDDLLHAAKAVEGFLNGESLVLVLEVGSARILLTGDAEVGAWTTILGNEEALALAAGATFLKVGHHGSHNATPLIFIREHLADAVPAVISTQAGDEKFRNGIPLKELFDEMKSRGMASVRSDKPPKKVTGIFTPSAGGRWIDCVIPC